MTPRIIPSECLPDTDVNPFVVTIADGRVDAEIDFLVCVDHETNPGTDAVVEILGNQRLQAIVPEFVQAAESHSAPSFGKLPAVLHLAAQQGATGNFTGLESPQDSIADAGS